MKGWRKALALLLAGAMSLSVAGCGGGGGSASGDDTTYTVWIGKAEDGSFYSDYHDNPILPYYLDRTYENADGEEVSVDLEFFVPAAGAEADNFNTLIATGDYTDVMDLTYYTGAVSDLYEEGVVVDLTDYMQYMPNYMNYLDEHPEVKMYATTLVDGEPKYLQIFGFNTTLEEWQGLVYRRDWIVKYGKNPVTGEAFSGDFTVQNEDGTWNEDSWVDDVVFPSGGSDPIYISDWEWMFEIFTEAMEDLGITDGYCTSIYYRGFSAMGLGNASFGGGMSTWYLSDDGTIKFGGTNGEMRAYLECMNTWYKKGWLDKAFAEHTNVMPWRIDEAVVRQGKVGAWHGMDSQLFTRMRTDDELTNDLMVFAAPYPINDIYGTAEEQNKEPYTLYQQSALSKGFIITDKIEDKDIVALLRLMDEFYVPENAILNSNGYDKEEIAENQNEYYLEHGLEDGAIWDSGLVSEDGRKIYYINPILSNDLTLQPTVAIGRLWGLQGETPTKVKQNVGETDQFKYHKYYIWGEMYKDTGTLSTNFFAQLNTNQSKIYGSTKTNVETFMETNLPKFITGEKDPYNDSDWDAYCKALEKYDPDAATQVLQEVLESLQSAN